MPLLPAPAMTQAAAPAYNRYMYGLAVFHARTRATISAADLIAKLRVSPAIAEAMMREMSLQGVLAPALQAVSGTFRAAKPQSGSGLQVGDTVQKAVREFLTEDEDADPLPPPTNDATCETPPE